MLDKRPRRVRNLSRATHTIIDEVIEGRCSICGGLATHMVTERTLIMYPPMSNVLCCEHFTFAIGDCSLYTYDIPVQRN
jgi:hypothetical protein